MFTAKEVALPSKQRMQGRRLVVVDIENVIGGAALSCDAVRWARDHIEEVFELQSEDHIVIGTSHIGLVPVGGTWPHCRYVVGSGPDGADLELLHVLDEDVASRFGEVVLVSGDHIFIDAATDLVASGVHVTVIAHRDGLSRRLRMAANDVIYLTNHFTPGALDGAA